MINVNHLDNDKRWRRVETGSGPRRLAGGWRGGGWRLDLSILHLHITTYRSI